MKKIVCLALVMMLALGIVCARADNVKLVLETQNSSIDDVCAVGDLVYLWGVFYEEDEHENIWELRVWNPADGSETRLQTEKLMDVDELAFEERDGSEIGITSLLTDGERLLVLDNMNAVVYEIAVDGEKAEAKEVVKLQDAGNILYFDANGEYSTKTISSAFVSDGMLWVRGYDYIEYPYQWFVDRWSLTDGSVTHFSVDHIQGLYPYKDGQMLGMIWDADTAYGDTGIETYPVLKVYDSEMQPTGVEIEMPKDDYDARDLIYDPARDLILYMHEYRLMGISADGTVKQYGYIPDQGLRSRMAWMDDGRLFLPGYNALYIREIDENFDPGKKLVVNGSWVDEGTRVFMDEHPDVAVYVSYEFSSTMEELNQALVAGEDTVDVFVVSVDYQSFEPMMEKGYCLALDEVPVLKEYTERLYDYLKEPLTYDGHVYALPAEGFSEEWGWNSVAAKEVGLTSEDIPGNYMELFDFVQRYADDFEEKYRDLWLTEDENVKDFLFDYMMSDYTQWMYATKGELSFDTPEFKALYEAWSKLDLTEMEELVRSDIEQEVWKDSLITRSSGGVGNFDWIDRLGTKYMNYEYFPIQMTEDTDPVIPMSLQVYIINPNSAYPDLAAELVRDKLENQVDGAWNYLLYADLNEPLRDPNYDRYVADREADIASLEKQIEEAETEAEKAELRETVESIRDYMENYMKYEEYTVSETALAYFRENLLPYIYVMRYNALDDENAGFRSLISRLQEGQMTLDQFIREADNKLRMIRLENE